MAVLFDMDGTLIDSFPAIASSVNHVRSMYGLPPLSLDQVKKHVGRGAAHLLAATVGRGDPEANLAAYREHHRTVLHSGTQLMPGARETLLPLKQGGRKLGVCSNKPVAFTRELIAWFGLAEALDVVLGPEDVARPKPAPDMLLEAMTRLNVPAARTLYVGDMTVDIETARAAGVHVWVVATGSDAPETLDRAAPDLRLANLPEVARRLGLDAVGRITPPPPPSPAP
jgi:phosphoglycolate phosphatase